MADKVLSSIRGKNCKKDLDIFLLNFTSSASLQPPTLPHLPLIHQQNQEQAQVINLVKSAKAEDILQLENVAAYIRGYICNKVILVVCEQCGSLLQADSSRDA
ncbi:RNA-directed DNA polymerase from mobile element jockey [Plakobranchus ocellatus]|uniref:RNA-directed DNA polymerase from mobile element jockey n=1 Tax=Plakobranchus ocellatus TaxID=259542 RepID=A0AAV4DRJ5_9GAST|nr:RNA-directed DNA polymerase from mobile element jockey [Plakobranchus ocellatus]